MWGVGAVGVTAAASGSQSTDSKRRVKQSRRHNFDTTPSAYAHVNDDPASVGCYDEVDEDNDGHSGDNGVEGVRQDDEDEEEVVQRLADMAVPVVAVAGGGGESVIMTTFMVVNATVLLEATGNKVKEFRALVKATEPKPHVIIVHEVNGYSGELRVREELLHGALAMYDAVYSQKLKVSETGARAGGGIMCLFKREMFRATTVQPPKVLDTTLLDGHVRTFCLWRKEHPGILPLIVTVAYIPPEDKEKKNGAMRRQGLHAVPALVEHVKRMWCGSQHVVVAHVNAPDGCQMIKT